MTRHTSHQSRLLVMDIAPQQLLTEHCVVLRRNDGLTIAPMQGTIANVGQVHGMVKIFTQVLFQRFVGKLFHQIRNEEKAHVAIHILLLFHRALHDRVDNPLLIVIHHIHILCNTHRMSLVDMITEILRLWSVLVIRLQMERNP